MGNLHIFLKRNLIFCLLQSLLVGCFDDLHPTLDARLGESLTLSQLPHYAGFFKLLLEFFDGLV